MPVANTSSERRTSSLMKKSKIVHQREPPTPRSWVEGPDAVLLLTEIAPHTYSAPVAIAPSLHGFQIKTAAAERLPAHSIRHEADYVILTFTTETPPPYVLFTAHMESNMSHIICLFPES